MININIITTQPSIFDSFLQTGLIARAIEKRICKIKIVNLYDYGLGPHKKVDDTPYGGGAGMVIRVDVLAAALKKTAQKSKIILLTPQGKTLKQKMAKKISREKNITLISGRFEGYDERIRGLVDEEISIGDYILTSGDLPAMVLVDTVLRNVNGFINKEESIKTESFNDNLLEYPQYTRPYDFKNDKVPQILLSGDHKKILEWRVKKALEKTKNKRPDLKDKKDKFI